MHIVTIGGGEICVYQCVNGVLEHQYYQNAEVLPVGKNK